MCGLNGVFSLKAVFKVPCTCYESLILLCNIKPIFHCDAKLLASGNFALPNTKDSTFALPNAKHTNMLVSLVLVDANFLGWPCTFLFCMRYPRRQPPTPVSGI